MRSTPQRSKKNESKLSARFNERNKHRKEVTAEIESFTPQSSSPETPSKEVTWKTRRNGQAFEMDDFKMAKIVHKLMQAQADVEMLVASKKLNQSQSKSVTRINQKNKKVQSRINQSKL